jgi:hypothetical protein
MPAAGSGSAPRTARCSSSSPATLATRSIGSRDCRPTTLPRRYEPASRSRFPAASNGCLAPRSAAYLAAAHAYLGKEERAQFYIGEFRNVFTQRITPGRSPEPDEAMRWLMHVNPFRREEDLQHFTEGARLAGLEGVSAPAPASRLAWPLGNVFRKEGELWLVCYEQEAAHVPEVRGLQDIAQLLQRPSEEVHCLALAGQPADTGRGVEVLAEAARRAYRARLRELETELAEAENANDEGRAERLAEERERLLEEMRKASGLGGRSRKMGDAAERARTAVAWRIRHAIKKLQTGHPTLARHFSNSIKTGVFCSYTPEKETRWSV